MWMPPVWYELLYTLQSKKLSHPLSGTGWGCLYKIFSHYIMILYTNAKNSSWKGMLVYRLHEVTTIVFTV